ncbi:trypsin-like peptidase domain-containing protein [Streptomyces sp. LN549]|uniref:trypsin-like peptidase domain-containing protein n=1 Tax=Streptomyces sp. LN549 TaxID=3112979 RepID=UPI00372199E6
MPVIGGSERRTVEVLSTEDGEESYGTGYIIAPGLVLTAQHVAQPTPRHVRVRDLLPAEFVPARVVWCDPRLDAALLEADSDMVGAGMATVRFGELVCSDAAHRPRCTLSGFPKAMRRKAGSDPDRFIDDLKTVDGTIAPHTGSRSKLYGFEVSGALPRFYENWKGLSGAGVFCHGCLSPWCARSTSSGIAA